MEIGNAISSLVLSSMVQMNQRGGTNEDGVLTVNTADHYSDSSVFHDYETWKAAQPAQELPEERGFNQKTLTYLAQRFPGETFDSINQHIDAIHAMRNIGIIDENQFTTEMNTICAGQTDTADEETVSR
jgi:hypothetical protein